MKFEISENISYPVERAFHVLRDDLAKLVPYLGSVKEVRVVERKQLNENEVEILNHWFGVGTVPPGLDKVIKPELFQWKDHAFWHSNQMLCHWTLESLVTKDLFTCSGTNRLRPVDENNTIMTISGEIQVYPDRAVPFLLKPLARTLAPAIEAFVIKMLEPNLKDTAKAVQKFLDSQE